MMYPYGNGMGASGWIVMTFILLGFLGVTIAAAVVVVRGIDRHGPAALSSDESEKTLADRFARGDIDDEEYEKRLRILRANRFHPSM